MPRVKGKEFSECKIWNRPGFKGLEILIGLVYIVIMNRRSSPDLTISYNYQFARFTGIIEKPNIKLP